MFGSKRASSVAVGDVETVIGKDTVIKGSISSQGTIRIDGQLEGDLSTEEGAIVGETGVIRAQVTAKNATIAGTIYGNVDVAGKLEFLPSARIYGDIKVAALVISEGAIFKGACEMRSERLNDE